MDNFRTSFQEKEKGIIAKVVCLPRTTCTTQPVVDAPTSGTCRRGVVGPKFLLPANDLSWVPWEMEKGRNCRRCKKKRKRYAYGDSFKSYEDKKEKALCTTMIDDEIQKKRKKDGSLLSTFPSSVVAFDTGAECMSSVTFI